MNRVERLQVFSERLNLANQKKGNQSLREIERNTKINHTSLSEMTLGHQMPNTWNLIKLAKYFDVSVDWLLGVTDGDD